MYFYSALLADEKIYHEEHEDHEGGRNPLFMLSSMLFVSFVVENIS